MKRPHSTQKALSVHRHVEPQKKTFKQPKLTYVAPKLNKHGKVEKLTQSFFGSFSP